MILLAAKPCVGTNQKFQDVSWIIYYFEDLSVRWPTVDEWRQSERGQLPCVNEDGYGLISNAFYESITIKSTIKIAIRQILLTVWFSMVLNQSDICNLNDCSEYRIWNDQTFSTFCFLTSTTHISSLGQNNPSYKLIVGLETQLHCIMFWCRGGVFWGTVWYAGYWCCIPFTKLCCIPFSEFCHIPFPKLWYSTISIVRIILVRIVRCMFHWIVWDIIYVL